MPAPWVPLLVASVNHPLWNSARFSFRPVDLWELRPFFPGQKSDLQTLLGVQSENFEPRQAFLLATISAGIGGSYIFPLIDSSESLTTNVQFALATAPFAFLIFSVVFPSQLQVAMRRLSQLQVGERRRRTYHEAGHFLVGHLVGLRIDGFSVDAGDAAVSLQAPQEANIDSISVVSMAGIAAEAIEFGNAKGGRADLAQLRVLFYQSAPRILDRRAQDERIRWAMLMALTLLTNHRNELDALVHTISSGGDVDACIVAIESCRQA